MDQIQQSGLFISDLLNQGFHRFFSEAKLVAQEFKIMPCIKSIDFIGFGEDAVFLIFQKIRSQTTRTGNRVQSCREKTVIIGCQPIMSFPFSRINPNISVSSIL